MTSPVWCTATLLVAFAFISEVSVHNFNADYDLEPYIEDESVIIPYMADEEYIRHIHSIFNAYRGDMGEQLVIETNAFIDTKYRTWKRNADFINSLLALPKGMNDAGR